MSIIVRFSPIGLTAEQYDGTIRTLQSTEGGFPPAGLVTHVCHGTEGSLLVTEVWDSAEQFEAFGEQLMPVLAAAGIEFSGAPEIAEVRNLVQR